MEDLVAWMSDQDAAVLTRSCTRRERCAVVLAEPAMWSGPEASDPRDAAYAPHTAQMLPLRGARAEVLSGWAITADRLNRFDDLWS